jgi:hypothetical protein
MKKLKNINDFTIKEYQEYTNLLKNDDSIFDILAMHGIENSYELDNNTFTKYRQEAASMQLKNVGTKLIYQIGNQKYKACLNLTKIKAAQFIDFQGYMSDYKLEQVLSVFLIPIKKSILGKQIANKYNDNYDVLEVQNNIFNNMKMIDANSLASFFLTSSINLLEVKKAYSEKQMMKMKIKEMKKLKLK